MRKHSRKETLTKEEEDALYQAALNTPEERRLQSMLPKSGETLQMYSRRVNFLLPAEFGPDRSLGRLPGLQDKNWLGSGKYGEIENYVLRMKARSLRSKDRKEVVNWMRQLVDEFLDAAEHGDDELIAKLIAQGVPVNYKQKGTSATALHYIAGYAARPAFRVLIKSKDVDYLARDKQGRLASELAFVDGCDPAMARLLRSKEQKQAQALGIKVTRRPQN